MEKEKLLQEQVQLKERLSELVNIINSEEYFKLTDGEKQLLSTQRIGMEMYLNSLNTRIWGEKQGYNPNTSSLIGLLTSMILLPNSSCPSYTIPNEAQKEQ